MSKKPEARWYPDVQPPTAMPFAPPPPIPTNQNQPMPDSHVWALIVLFLGIFAIGGTILVFLMHDTFEKGAIEANAKLRAAELEVQAATAPTHVSLDCDFNLEGNFQFDGREVDVSNLTEEQSAWNMTTEHYDVTNGSKVIYHESFGSDRIPAKEINVPDFTQLRVQKINGHCAMSAQVPAAILKKVMEQ